MVRKPAFPSRHEAEAGTGDRPGIAIALVLLAMAVFVSMDGLAKTLAGQGLAPELIVLWRYAMVTVFLGPMIAMRWRERPLRTRRPGLHIARGLLLLGAAVFFIYAMRTLPLETSTAIGFVSPLYVTALSIPFLGERVGLRRWSAVAVGFIGVLIIIRPWAESFQPAMLFPLVSSLCWASGLIITRAMRGQERPLTVLVWSTASGLLAILPLGLTEWQMPTSTQMMLLLATAVCHAAGQYLTIRAFMLASASILAPFSYSTIVWATLIGAIFFDSIADAATILGTGVLVAAGIYVWHRERKITGKPTVTGGSIAEATVAIEDDGK